MSQTPEDLLIIYESGAEQWASYLHFHLVGHIPEGGICCYDIASVTRSDFLRLGRYKCKLLILSLGMIEGLCQLRRFFLSRVLRPEVNVVILLCGVTSLDPLLELVPLKAEDLLQITSEQEPQDYQTAVAEVVQKAKKADSTIGRSVPELKEENKLSSGELNAHPSLLILPTRVPCGNPGEIFILLQEIISCKEVEVDFSGSKQQLRLKSENWNASTLCVALPDFQAGDVTVTLYCKGVVKGKAILQYYNTMEDVVHLLQQAADPVKFMCQAFQVSSVEKLDQTLASCLMRKMPTGGFLSLQCDQFPAGEFEPLGDIPTLLHFAAQYGLKDLVSALLQCPGAIQALNIPNGRGHTPVHLAYLHGHSQLYMLLQESLGADESDGNLDTGVYELMGQTAKLHLTDPVLNDEESEENVYAPLGSDNAEYDTIFTSSCPVVIANRPPAPTPRPDCLLTPEDKTPFIAQVFQKRKTQEKSDTDTVYSLPARQMRPQESSGMYDTFMPSQAPGLDELIKLQEEVKSGSLSVDDALDRFDNWQRLQRGMDRVQQEKVEQLRTSLNREDDESIYDKISIIHHTQTDSATECRKETRLMNSEFYSKPHKK